MPAMTVQAQGHTWCPGTYVERWPAVGRAGGDDGDGLGDDATGGLANAEIAGSSCGVVRGAYTGTDVAGGGCVGG